MNAGLRTSASGMIAQQRMIDIIANNIANVNTTGFKRSRVSFQDVLYETVRGGRISGGTGIETVGPVQVGRGVRMSAALRLHSQGAVELTDRPLNLAVQGDGLFQLQRPDYTVAYSRDGSFTLSDNGALITNDGYMVMPGIFIPLDATGVTITPSGVVTVTSQGSTDPIDVGRIELARFVNPSGLLSIGENQYLETPASGEPMVGLPDESGFGRLLQGALEASNVEIVQEMTDMIAAQRAYEINARAIRVGDDMMQITNDLIR
jgi:flagellar basal-body rod protein FlgG